MVGKSVILPGLVGKTEEEKEDKGAENNGPAPELQRNHFEVVTTPYQRRNLLDVGEIEMNILPTDVWVEGNTSLDRNAVERNWYVEQNLNASKAHESNESIGGNAAIA